MADQSNIMRISLSDVADTLNIPEALLKASFLHFLSVVPEAGDHVEVIDKSVGGVLCKSYRVDVFALSAFLDWQKCNGRFFGVQCRAIEGGASNGR